MCVARCWEAEGEAVRSDSLSYRRLERKRKSVMPFSHADVWWWWCFYMWDSWCSPTLQCSLDFILLQQMHSQSTALTINMHKCTRQRAAFTFDGLQGSNVSLTRHNEPVSPHTSVTVMSLHPGAHALLFFSLLSSSFSQLHTVTARLIARFCFPRLLSTPPMATTHLPKAVTDARPTRQTATHIHTSGITKTIPSSEHAA